MSIPLDEFDPAHSPPIPPPRFARPVWPLRVSVLYLVVVVVVALVNRTLAEAQWWSTLLIYLPQVLYLVPAPLVLLTVLWSQDRRALGVFIGTLLLIAGPIMGGHVPLPSLIPADAPRVRVLAYNVQGGKAGFELLQAQIERFRPDVVIFSEARDWGNEQPLQEYLGKQFPNWASISGGDVFIASHWPFAGTESLPLSDLRTRDPSLDREKVRALVDAPFGRFQVVGVHFYTAVYGRTLKKEWKHVPAYMRHTGDIRKAQAKDLLAWTGKMDEPVILAGDFNTPPAGQIYQSLLGSFGDSFAERGLGWGYTFQSNRPLLRIDYIFHSRQWDVVRCEVGLERGSDHRPVFAELALRK
jgi:endonuclease/exonuclease/phosphatase (EEP) superfamily protein YafD